MESNQYESSPSNLTSGTVHIYENGVLMPKTEVFVNECIVNISVNNRIVEILPALNEHIAWLGMGYLYQITEFSPDELASGCAIGSDFSIQLDQTKNPGCMCKKIFSVEKKNKLLSGDSLVLKSDTVFNMFNDFNNASFNFRKTGALHGAALYDVNGDQSVFIEDIARSNTIYKSTGYLLTNKITSQRIIVLSCRVNTLILNLLINIGFKTILTRASVTYQAYAKAKKYGITLIGFIKENRFTIFSGVENIQF